MIYNEKIEELINSALIDGVLTEKEKEILFKRAQAEGIDLDEFEMVLNARLVEQKKKEDQETKRMQLDTSVDLLDDDEDDDNNENNCLSKINNLSFYPQLLLIIPLLLGVIYVACLLYSLGIIMFWNSFGKTTYKWMDQMWERYIKYVNSFVYSDRDSKVERIIQQITCICLDVIFGFLCIYGVGICFAYALIMFWNSFGKKNMKWLSEMCKWYFNRVNKDFTTLIKSISNSRNGEKVTESGENE